MFGLAANCASASGMSHLKTWQTLAANPIPIQHTYPLRSILCPISPFGGHVHNQIKRRAELLEKARERVFYVVVQREAMNFSCFEEFFKAYEIPDEVRMRLGPSRQK